MESTDNSISMSGGDILFARLAYNLLESGDVEEATNVLEKGLRSYPSYAQGHYILAKCYMKQHLTDEARAELERVLRYDPNHINAIKDLSSIHFINGFQDLYKEYLLKLFTLNPINDEIIDEVRKLGEFELWSASNENLPRIKSSTPPDTTPAPAEATAPKSEEPAKKQDFAASENLFDPIFPPKVDLSQFDNLHDDFTTILHGNLELPRKPVSSDEIDFDLLKHKEDIFGQETAGEPDNEEIVTEDSTESMDDLIGEDEELVIRQINETDEHLSIGDEEDILQPQDILAFPPEIPEAELPPVSGEEDQEAPPRHPLKKLV